MSRHDSVTRENRKRQFLREQRELQSHGMPNWFDQKDQRKSKRIYRSSMAKRGPELDPANATVGPSLRPSAAETPSEQVKKVGGELGYQQHPDDQINRSPIGGAERLTLSGVGSGA